MKNFLPQQGQGKIGVLTHTSSVGKWEPPPFLMASSLAILKKIYKYTYT